LVQRIEELQGPIGKLKQRGTGHRIEHAGNAGRIEDEIGKLEHVAHGSADGCVASEQLAERVPFQREPHVQTVRALQVVEAIAVLQVLQLVLEDEVEGRPEQTAEHGRFLGHTTGPEIDVVQTAGGGRSGQDRIIRRDQGRCRGALVRDRGCAGDAGMRRVRGDEVGERLGMPQAELELHPVGVRHERRISGCGEELLPRHVQPRDPFTAAARDVDRREVERQANERVPDRGGHELVELVSDLANRAADDGAGRFCRGQRSCRPSVVVRGRVEERIEQADVVDRSVDVGAPHPLGQHRVSKAIDRVRELGRNRRVDRGDASEERVDERLDLARELLEDQVLVFHLGHEARGLEQVLAVAPPRGGIDGVPFGDVGGRQKCVDQLIDVVAEPVVLRVEDVVNH